MTKRLANIVAKILQTHDKVRNRNVGGAGGIWTGTKPGKLEYTFIAAEDLDELEAAFKQDVEDGG